MKSNFSVIRRGQRVIRMVSELHRMGYQKLRLMPYVHPLAWRLAIAPAACFHSDHGSVLLDSRFNEAAVYSSASGSSYFDWEDASNDSAIQLAEKFVLRFPGIARQGKGRDWAYAGWLAELLSVLRSGDYLPVIQWEYMDAPARDLRWVPLWEHTDGGVGPSESEFVLPPLIEQRPAAPDANSELVLSEGGIYVRLLATVAGFQLKHGYSPTRLQATADTVATLAIHVFSPAGFRHLQSKLKLEIVSEGMWAGGEGSDVFDYAMEGWQGESPGLEAARAWLWAPAVSVRPADPESCARRAHNS